MTIAVASAWGDGLEDDQAAAATEPASRTALSWRRSTI
jgi:hypothetical protein